MGVVTFKILFDNPAKTYFAGDTVAGRIILVLNSPKKCRGVRVKIKGEANTVWQKGSSNGRIKRLRGHEEYFLSKYYHVGGESEELELDPGEHTFLFEYVLPRNLPSSFESKFGHIRYTVKATIDRPWKFDIETKAAFTVVSRYDLNTDPNASEPVEVSKTKTFGCFSTTPPLNVNLSLPVRGYVPGQSIPIKVNIKNQSGVEIYNVKVKLEKYVTFRVTKPHSGKKKRNTTILKVHKGKIVNNVVSFDHVFKIPPLPPSNLNNCSIIDVRYALELEAYVDRICSRNLKISTPILIGTIPLVNYYSLVASAVNSDGEQFLPSAPVPLTPLPSASFPSAPPNYSTVVNSPNRNYDLPPPTYEESIFLAKSIQDEDESEHIMGIREPFAPRYPVYSFPSTS